ncbi:MAG: hypothetical protein GY861_14045 [bacterium]|nr:hypothetical protein [bacterium]
MAKFNKTDWQILKYAIQGSPYEYGYELHHMVKGQREEALSLVIPLTLSEHGTQFSHAKNWPDSRSVPSEKKQEAIEFWKHFLTEDDFKYFYDRDMV